MIRPGGNREKIADQFRQEGKIIRPHRSGLTGFEGVLADKKCRLRILIAGFRGGCLFLVGTVVV
jgi:hypothetical protein